MASDWNMVSNQQSFIDELIDQWRDCFIACLKAKSNKKLSYRWQTASAIADKPRDAGL